MEGFNKMFQWYCLDAVCSASFHPTLIQPMSPCSVLCVIREPRRWERRGSRMVLMACRLLKPDHIHSLHPHPTTTPPPAPDKDIYTHSHTHTLHLKMDALMVLFSLHHTCSGFVHWSFAINIIMCNL